MPSVIRSLVAFLIVCLLVTGAFSQEKDGRYYEGHARRAYQEKNWPAFLENMKIAAELRPNHPRLMYNLAVAYALNNKPSDATSWLRKTADMGLVFNAATDHDLDSLKQEPQFSEIIKQFEKNQAPKISSLKAFTVHEKGLVPESVAYDETSGMFYLSSVYKRKILRVSKSGEVSSFAGEAEGLWSVMGMKVDSSRRLLWVCSTAHPQMANFQAQDKGKTALLKFDLRTGKLVAKYQPSDTTKQHWFGDLVISKTGDVYTTDSVTPAVYVIKHNSNRLELLLEGKPLLSPQGLDFTKDQRQLFVADYSKGLFLVDLTTKETRSIVSDVTLLGIDGLYYYAGSLIGVQNGVNPQRVIRCTLNKDLSRIDKFETIEANNPLFDEPTLGVLVKNNFYFVANSQWGAIDESGHLAPEDKLKDPWVLKVDLRK